MLKFRTLCCRLCQKYCPTVLRVLSPAVLTIQYPQFDSIQPYLSMHYFYILVRYKQQLLKDHPPSYKGQNIKFSYKVLIGIGRINQPLCILKLPFRLLEFEGKEYNAMIC